MTLFLFDPIKALTSTFFFSPEAGSIQSDYFQCSVVHSYLSYDFDYLSFNELPKVCFLTRWLDAVLQSTQLDQDYIRHEHFPRHEDMPFYALTDIIQGGNGSYTAQTNP